MVMSLDGFVADADDGRPELLPDAPGSEDPHGAVGAVICGRRSFDLAGGWGGRHPLGAPVFVVTHSVPFGWPRDDAQVSFVTDGIERALGDAAEVAGDSTIAVTSPSLARQFLDAGLLDRIRVSVAPVLLGEGVRFFDGLRHAPVELESIGVIDRRGAARLTYRVCRGRR
jgi:dihydrofolate reductase